MSDGIGTASSLDPAAVDALKGALRGRLVQPADPDYDTTRSVYNGMIDKRPALIARCAGVADVIRSLAFGRDHGLLIAVRGGGHNGGGLGTCDGGLVIDLSLMRGIRVDPATRTARVEGGCMVGDVDHATHAFGLAAPFGILSTTGVAGLTLGGGIGHLSRKCGLSIDNILEVDVVLANGTLVTATSDKNADLFWAIRGGGGNFGIVTSFLFQLHPIRNVFAGPTFYPIERSAEVLRWYREFIPGAPEELNGFFAFVTVPPAPIFPAELHMKKMCGVVWCYCGPADRAEQVLKPIREFGPPAMYGVGEMPLPVLQSLFDPLYPPGLQWYWRADFVNTISDAAIAEHGRFGSSLPTMHSTMHLYPIDRAVHRVAKDDTAFAYRDAQWAQVMVGVDPDPAKAATLKDWTIKYWEALHPHSAGGAYVNFMMDEGQDRVRATYRDNYDRLARIKQKYDPNNLFRVNQNIVPRSGTK
jgi:FAD/FMN-containing dehydrogenase